MGSAMDALKYGWSGLYGSSANASASAGVAAPNAIGSSGGSSETDLINHKSGIGSMYHSSSLMSSNTMKDYGNLQHDTSAGMSTKSSSYNDSAAGGGQLKSASNYSADSLSRSYFDSAMALKGYNDHHQHVSNRASGPTTSVGGNYDTNSGIKSFTPESGRTSSDSPDHTKSSSAINSLNQHQNQHGIQHHQSAGMGVGGDFSSQQQQAAALQAYYSQSMLQQTGLGGANGTGGGIGAGGSGSNASSNTPGSGSLPPLLPMAAQLSQYAGAAAAAANGATSGYQQSAAAAAAAGEYRRPLSVLF